jgi:hypothetical protein
MVGHGRQGRRATYTVGPDGIPGGVVSQDTVWGLCTAADIITALRPLRLGSATETPHRMAGGKRDYRRKQPDWMRIFCRARLCFETDIRNIPLFSCVPLMPQCPGQ